MNLKKCSGIEAGKRKVYKERKAITGKGSEWRRKIKKDKGK